MPVCGGGGTREGKLATAGRDVDVECGTREERGAKLATVAIHAFDGDADKTGPAGRSRAMVEKIKAAEGNILYTEYEGVGHNSWERAYGDPLNIIWLLTQSKE